MFNIHDLLLADKPVVHQIKPRNNPEKELIQKKLRSFERAVIVEVFMDPLSSSFWGASPVLRRLELEFGALVEIKYRTSGMLISWEDFELDGVSKPEHMAAYWQREAFEYKMPMDTQLWLENPPHSSFPASIAYKAAQLQNKLLADKFLRRMQEMLFVEGRNIAEWKIIKRAAKDVGLDLEVLLLQYNNGDGLKAFAEDQKRARQECVTQYPTIHLHTEGGDVRIVEPGFNWENLSSAVRGILPRENINKLERLIDIPSCFNFFDSLTFTEIQELTAIGGKELLKELEDLESDGTLVSFGCDTGRVWRTLD